MYELLIFLLNLICGTTMLVSSTCKIGGHKYSLNNPELWVNVFVSIGGLILILSLFSNLKQLSEILPVSSVAMFFIYQSYRTWKLQNKTKTKK